MSQENVELVRKSMNAFAERDVEALRELNDPEVELDWSASLGVEARVYQGIESVLRFYDSYFQAFEGIVWEELSFIDAGEHVVAPNMSRSCGRRQIERPQRHHPTGRARLR
jgi:hypothetical protein